MSQNDQNIMEAKYIEDFSNMDIAKGQMDIMEWLRKNNYPCTLANMMKLVQATMQYMKEIGVLDFLPFFGGVFKI